MVIHLPLLSAKANASGSASSTTDVEHTGAQHEPVLSCLLCLTSWLHTAIAKRYQSVQLTTAHPADSQRSETYVFNNRSAAGIKSRIGDFRVALST